MQAVPAGPGRPDVAHVPPVHPAVRGLLAAFVLLTAAGTTSLLVLAERTDEFFAWTIRPPLTAAVLGAGYGAGLVLSALSLRARAWPSVRVPFLTVLAFTWLTTAATALHVDRLHLNAPGAGPVAVPAAWVWVVVYIAVPVGMTVALALQVRPRTDSTDGTEGTDGSDGTAHGGYRTTAPGAPTRIPPLLAVLLAAQGALMAAAGVALLLAPTRVGWWPWELTPFTARTLAAWLLAFALAAALALRDGDLRTLRIATAAYAAFGGLQLLALARHGADLTGPRPAVAGWVVLMVSILLTGAAGRWSARATAPDRHRPAGQHGRG